jgi:hypothetical protein
MTESNLVFLLVYYGPVLYDLYLDSKWVLNFLRVLCLSLHYQWSNRATLDQINTAIPKLWMPTHFIMDVSYLVLSSFQQLRRY